MSQINTANPSVKIMGCKNASRRALGGSSRVRKADEAKVELLCTAALVYIKSTNYHKFSLLQLSYSQDPNTCTSKWFLRKD